MNHILNLMIYIIIHAAVKWQFSLKNIEEKLHRHDCYLKVVVSPFKQHAMSNDSYPKPDARGGKVAV